MRWTPASEEELARRGIGKPTKEVVETTPSPKPVKKPTKAKE